MLDLLEGTGIQVLSRRNIPCTFINSNSISYGLFVTSVYYSVVLKWGYTMLRSFYYINALTDQSVQQSLRDRSCRLLFLQVLYEMWTLFGQIMTSSASPSSSSLGSKKTVGISSEPDTIAATYLSIPVIMILLPLPNWLFNGVILRLLDFGLTASETGRSSIQVQSLTEVINSAVSLTALFHWFDSATSKRIWPQISGPSTRTSLSWLRAGT